MLRLISIAAMFTLLSGCGVIDPDIARFDLRMPARTFTVDTEQWDLMASSAVFPDIPCSSDAMCDAPVAAICQGEQCAGECAANGFCEMTAEVSLWRAVDLYSENPELQTINNQPLVDVRIERVHYTISENSLNVETPPFTLYMAPQGVMDPSDPSAREVGEIPAIAAGMQTGQTDVIVSAAQEAALEDFMGDYQTPFNVIAATVMRVQPGDPIPMGAITAIVGVDASAGL